MSFIDAVKAYFLKCSDFRSRSSRSEYWWAILFISLAIFPFAYVVGATIGGILFLMGYWEYLTPVLKIFTWSYVIFLIGALVTLSIRRLHDVDRSGWWFLLAFTTIGLIPLLVWFCTKGTDGDNRFGKNPLE